MPIHTIELPLPLWNHAATQAQTKRWKGMDVGLRDEEFHGIKHSNRNQVDCPYEILWKGMIFESWAMSLSYECKIHAGEWDM